MSAVVIPPGQGITLHARGNTLRFKAIGADTNGAFSLFEREVPQAARRPAAHRHPGTVEASYVVAGELALSADGTDYVVPSGGFALVPAGDIHTFRQRRPRSAAGTHPPFAITRPLLRRARYA